MLTLLNKALAKVELASAVIACVAVFAMVVTTSIEVIGRSAFTTSFPWVFEFQTQYLMIISYFMAVSYAQLKHDHVSIDLVVGRLSAKTRSVLDIVGLTVCAAIALLLMLNSWNLFYGSLQGGSLGQPSLPWPQWTSYSFVFFGFLILTIRFVVSALMTIMELVRDSPEGDVQGSSEISRGEGGAE